MPPRVKIQPQQITDAALALVRAGGPTAPSARAIALALGCSTQPIFTNFPTMEALKEAVVAAAYARYEETVRREAAVGDLPSYKTFGMGYVAFAQEEPELFRMLFADRRSMESADATVWTQAVGAVEAKGDVPPENAERLHTAMWVFVHGLASLIAAERLTYDREEVSALLTDCYQGLRLRYAQKEDTL